MGWMREASGASGEQPELPHDRADVEVGAAALHEAVAHLPHVAEGDLDGAAGGGDGPAGRAEVAVVRADAEELHAAALGVGDHGADLDARVGEGGDPVAGVIQVALRAAVDLARGDDVHLLAGRDDGGAAVERAVVEGGVELERDARRPARGGGGQRRGARALAGAGGGHASLRGWDGVERWAANAKRPSGGAPTAARVNCLTVHATVQ